MGNFIKENWFKIGVLIILFIIGLSITYYYVIFLPQKEKLEQILQKQSIDQELEIKTKSVELERQKITDNKQALSLNKNLLDECLLKVEKDFDRAKNTKNISITEYCNSAYNPNSELTKAYRALNYTEDLIKTVEENNCRNNTNEWFKEAEITYEKERDFCLKRF